jgi:hypothetical protein
MAGMSDQQVARLKVRCSAILNNADAFDAQLIQLCRLLRR